MTEWRKYEGTDEQIAEMRESCRVAGFVYRYRLNDGRLSTQVRTQFDLSFLTHNELGAPAEYLICERHPLMHMIMTQAQTGQPVWIKVDRKNCIDFLRTTFPEDTLTKIDETEEVIVTTKPNWNIPGAEYSFTPFEE